MITLKTFANPCNLFYQLETCILLGILADLLLFDQSQCLLPDFLTFGEFPELSVRTTQTRLKTFRLEKLLESDAIKVILEGVLRDGDFLFKEML